MIRHLIEDWQCRLLGCSWEARRAYDYCPRCGQARWHITARYDADSEPAARPRPWPRPVQVLQDRLLVALGLLDCEGSELFVTSEEPAEAI